MNGSIREEDIPGRVHRAGTRSVQTLQRHHHPQRIFQRRQLKPRLRFSVRLSSFSSSCWFSRWAAVLRHNSDFWICDFGFWILDCPTRSPERKWRVEGGAFGYLDASVIIGWYRLLPVSERWGRRNGKWELTQRRK